MVPAKPNKVSRITVACNSCRFRKQKRPILTPLSGPAKGYIEALEHRLHETESLLLNLLAQIPDSQLSATVQGRQDRSSRHRNSGSPPQTYSSSSRPGKRGTDYWKKFPLHTVQEIRDWQNDCLSNGGDGSPRHSLGPEVVKHSSVSHSEYQPETRSPKDQVPEFSGYRELPTLPRIYQIEIPNSPADAGLSPAKVAYSNGLDGEARENRPRMDPVFEAIQYQRARAEAVHEFSNIQKPSLWRGAPSVSFQQQFLW
ncbi:hypothetical protein AbraIFM66951_010272 [Aspergillus brasiliensis]|uniref:Uncharacterized protein n=1 Tax=Aspergillus brasiliensis TaxID=319629 RepID=A0A9W6DKW2_9EURO|nr:hypothetical protein AbraCBS73388_002985 [Aspergillus brasiliensis]GKZ41544.1 hypothetical protein AbraIFM66951_010272 [Aspergillus brasiliensis]